MILINVAFMFFLSLRTRDLHSYVSYGLHPPASLIFYFLRCATEKNEQLKCDYKVKNSDKSNDWLKLID